MSGLKISGVDELKSAGYDQLTFNNLIESALFHVDAASIADLTAAGFDHLPFNKLVEASIFKVDSNFARRLRTWASASCRFKSWSSCESTRSRQSTLTKFVKWVSTISASIGWCN